MSRSQLPLVTLALALLGGAALRAHDFWIEPSAFAPASGQRIAIRLRVGEDFRGDPVPRLPEQIERFEILGRTGSAPVLGQAGRDPAGYASFATPGFHWLVYDSHPSTLELEPARFETYLGEEGLESIRGERARRGARPGVATGKVKELFSRCAKAAIAAGGRGGTGFDTPLGLTLELIPEVDPTALREGGALPLRLLYRGKPLASALVVAFSREDPASKVKARSDSKGRVALRLGRSGSWLVKAVHMVDAPTGSGADYESFWASLTFEIAKSP